MVIKNDPILENAQKTVDSFTSIPYDLVRQFSLE